MEYNGIHVGEIEIQGFEGRETSSEWVKKGTYGGRNEGFQD